MASNGKIQDMGVVPGTGDPSSCVGLFHTLSLLFLWHCRRSLCSCRLVSLIIISPHGRPRQLGTKFFLWVSYIQPLISFPSPSFDLSTILFFFFFFLLLDSTGITHSPSFCVWRFCPHQGNTTPTGSAYRRFVHSSFRASSAASFTCAFGRTFFFAHLLTRQRQYHMPLCFSAVRGFICPAFPVMMNQMSGRSLCKILQPSSFFFPGVWKFRNVLCGGLLLNYAQDVMI